MVGFNRRVPPVPVVLAALVLWVSFAWGLPAEPAAEGDANVAAAEDTWRCGNCDAENDPSAKYCTGCGAKKAGEAEAAAEDAWAGVRISEAYDYAKCTRCGEKNEVRAERCSDCGCELPQPSAEMTDPDMVFVPGKGYYREGTVLEPGKSRKGLWITGLVLSGVGSFMIIGSAPGIRDSVEVNSFLIVVLVAGVGATAVGVPLFIKGVTKTKPVYAFGGDERFDLYERPAFARRSPDSDGVAFKIEVTLFGF